MSSFLRKQNVLLWRQSFVRLHDRCIFRFEDRWEQDLRSNHQWCHLQSFSRRRKFHPRPKIAEVLTPCSIPIAKKCTAWRYPTDDILTNVSIVMSFTQVSKSIQETRMIQHPPNYMASGAVMHGCILARYSHWLSKNSGAIFSQCGVGLQHRARLGNKHECFICRCVGASMRIRCNWEYASRLRTCDWVTQREFRFEAACQDVQTVIGTE